MNTPLPNPTLPTAQGLSITSMVLGICSAFFFWLFAVVPILAIIFGGVAMHQQKQAGVKPNGMAITGLTLGIIFTAVFGLVILADSGNW